MEGGVAAVAAAAAATVTTAVAPPGPPSNGAVGGAAAAPPPFLMKTYEMVDDPSTDGVVSWGEGNNSFVVWSTPEFARDLLPKYFKHSNFSSFVRQLNTYGFRKVDPDRWEFANEGFLRGQKHLLKTINRRKPLNANNQVQVQNQQQQQPQLQNGPLPSCVEVGNFGMEEEIEMLKRDKNVLMQELVRLRQQQQTTDHQLETLGKRLQGMEQRQQQMMSFLAKAMQSPTFLAQFVQQNENSRRRIVAANKKRRLPKQDDGLMDSAESLSLDGQIIKYQPLINEAAKAMLRKILQQDSSSSHRFESMGGNADNFLLENNCMPTTPQAFDTSSSTGNSAVTLAEVPGNSAGMQVPGNSAGMPYMATSSGLSAICSPSTPPEIQRPVFDNIPSNVLHNMSNNSSRVLPNMSAAAPSLPKAMTPGPSDISIPGFPDLHDLITDDPVNIPGGGGGGFEMPGPECIFPLLPEDDDDSIPIDTDEILSSDDTQKLPGIIDSFWEQFLDEELYQLFCGPSGPQGDVEAIRVVRDPDTSLGKGIAYVLFKTREAANGVVRKRSLKIRDRLLRLTHAKAPDATPKKTDAGKTRGGPKQKTSFTPGSKSREGSDSNKRKEPASLSYQGLKSTKSGVVKKAKVIRRPSNQGKQQGSRPSETGQSESSRKSKRPAVAARKVKQLTKKRKLDGSTPENTHRSKKARK